MNTTQDKILDHTMEQLSALFDGELALDEARFLQRRLEHDAALAGCVSRWQAIGDALRGQGSALAPAGFSARVAVAVAAEAAPARREPRSRRGWVPGAALAASVALVAFFALRQPPVASGGDADGAAPAAQVAQAAVPGTTIAPDGAPAQPAPQAPQAPAQQAAQLAAAVAVAEVPRRAAARRTSTASRGQAQRAAATRAARAALDAQPQFAVAAAGPLPASALPAAVSPDNPFAPAPAGQVVAARPWPRALLPNAGAFNVGYGNLQPNPPQEGAFHPFRPRTVPAGQPAPQDAQETSPR